MAFLSQFWRRMTATRYTRALEVEVARLRAENRALLNSILGIAGVPPVLVADAELPLGMGAQVSRERGNQVEPGSQDAEVTLRNVLSPTMDVNHSDTTDGNTRSAAGRAQEAKPKSKDARRAAAQALSTNANRSANTARTSMSRGASHFAKKGSSQVAAPMRRRSWQQINRMLEFESARKKPQEISSE